MSPASNPIFVLAAGGTGGHLFPAEALARELVRQGGAVHLATDRRADAFAEKVPGVAVCQVRAGRFGGGPLRVAYGVAEMALGIMQARRLLRRLAPDVVVGFGGYVSVPTTLAASQLGVARPIAAASSIPETRSARRSSPSDKPATSRPSRAARSNC